MADLMSDHGTDATVVDSLIGPIIIKWRLENSRGENDLIIQRIVIGIDDLRAHKPFRAVNLLAQLAQVLLQVPFGRHHQIL